MNHLPIHHHVTTVLKILVANPNKVTLIADSPHLHLKTCLPTSNLPIDQLAPKQPPQLILRPKATTMVCLSITVLGRSLLGFYTPVYIRLKAAELPLGEHLLLVRHRNSIASHKPILKKSTHWNLPNMRLLFVL